MAYDTQELHQRCLEAIDREGLYFIKDIPPTIGIAESTWWDHFPKDSEEHKEQVLALNYQKAHTKIRMRHRWKNSGNATLELALYKLIAEDDERRALAQQYIDHTTQGDAIAPIAWEELSEDTIKEIFDAIRSAEAED